MKAKSFGLVGKEGQDIGVILVRVGDESKEFWVSDKVKKGLIGLKLTLCDEEF